MKNDLYVFATISNGTESWIDVIDFSNQYLEFKTDTQRFNLILNTAWSDLSPMSYAPMPSKEWMDKYAVDFFFELCNEEDMGVFVSQKKPPDLVRLGGKVSSKQKRKKGKKK